VLKEAEIPKIEPFNEEKEEISDEIEEIE
jgi:hypothetical protein